MFVLAPGTSLHSISPRTTGQSTVSSMEMPLVLIMLPESTVNPAIGNRSERKAASSTESQHGKGRAFLTEQSLF